nr:response regulator [uncultured Desulfobacter sp.]
MSTPHLILVIDDDLISRNIIATLFDKHGFQTAKAASGREGIEIAMAQHPDLIFLDGDMPELDGFQTCKLLKKSPEISGIPVVFVSGLNHKDDILKAYKAGAFDFIPKPIEPSITLAKTHTILKYQELIQDKDSLLKISRLLLRKLNNLMNTLALDQKISTSQKELFKSSARLSSTLENLRTDLNQALKTLDMAELNLQFTDRVHQQLNELSKIAISMKTILHPGQDQTHRKKIDKQSTVSAFLSDDDTSLDQNAIDQIMEQFNPDN